MPTQRRCYSERAGMPVPRSSTNPSDQRKSRSESASRGRSITERTERASVLVRLLETSLLA
jgi:hypothetical protein